jgi:hypothetical protein
MHFQNYRDFYQLKLIPINLNDHMPSSDVTHWLIALEGHAPSDDSEFYLWNVVVYQANSDGYLHKKKPYYISSSFNCFHKACEAASKLTEKMKNPHFNFVATENIG